MKEIATEIGVPESTLRLYRDEFAEFVPATGEGRRRRYDSGAAQTLKRIVEWKKAGASAITIRQELMRTQTPQEKRKTATHEDRIAGLLVAVEAQGNEIALLRAEVGAMRGEIGRLVTLLSLERGEAKTMQAVQSERLAVK